MRNVILIGDNLTWLKKLPSDSVHCCVTSPPYYGLRSYIAADSPDKKHEIGLEATPEQYIEALVEVFREVRRVLRPDGLMWLNLGDSYWHNRSENGAFHEDGNLSKAYQARAGGKSHAVYKPKDLMFIPHRVAMALQADGWYIRSDIVWAKVNPMPESVQDRPTKSHEYVFLCAKSERYYYDIDAIREPMADSTVTRYKTDWNGNTERGYITGEQNHMNKFMADNEAKQEALIRGANKRDVWHINTIASGIEHYATMPLELAETCIKTSPKAVCSECGCPYVASIEITHENYTSYNHPKRTGGAISGGIGKNFPDTVRKHKGYNPSCTCNAPAANAVVLDPFGGAGTTALAAMRLNRDYILIELNIKYAGYAQKRLQEKDPYQDKPLRDGGKQLSLFKD